MVKVVTDREGFALSFSRYPIPFPRNPRAIAVKKSIGVYTFRKQALLSYGAWPTGPLEGAESIEQIRVIYNGLRMKMHTGRETGVAVDTPEQAELVRQILLSRRP